MSLSNTFYKNVHLLTPKDKDKLVYKFIVKEVAKFNLNLLTVNNVTNLAFHNHSSFLPDHLVTPVKNLLGLNLKFCPTPARVKVLNYIEAAKEFRRKVFWQSFFIDNNNGLNVDNHLYEPKLHIKSTTEPNPFALDKDMVFYLNKLVSMSKSLTTFKPNNNFNNNLDKSKIKTLRYIRNVKHNIIVCNSDKNLGPVLLDYQSYIVTPQTSFNNNKICLSYIDLANSLLHDTDTYELIDKNKYYSIQKIINFKIISLKKLFILAIRNITYYDDDTRYARLKELNIFTEFIKNFDKNIKSLKLKKFYILIKLHKTPITARPIVSSINSDIYGISKYLDVLLTPIMLQQMSFIKDSNSIIELINKIQHEANDILMTLDATSLYTNISFDLTKKALTYFLHKFSSSNPLYDSIDIIIQSVQLLFEENYFFFEDKWFYHQIKGIAMGTPAAVVIANLVVAYLEEILFTNSMFKHIKLYKRYIDDVLIIFNLNNISVDMVIQNFQRMEEFGITWSSKFSTASIDFLDLTIFHHDKLFLTKTFQKDLNLYLYIVKSSAHPPGTLKGLIFSQLRKFITQNTLPRDAKFFVYKFYENLLKRGYTKKELTPLFVYGLNSLTEVSRSQKKKMLQQNNSLKQLFLSLPYDPNGPTASEIYNILEIDIINDVLKKIFLIPTEITIGFFRPRNLQELVKKNFSIVSTETTD